MITGTVVNRFAIYLILGIVIVSGPIIPGLDFTELHADDRDIPSSAEVEVVTSPRDEFSIAPAKFGAGFYIYSSPARVRIGAVGGSPTLIYELAIPALGRNLISVTFLSSSNEGQVIELELERSSIDQRSLERDRYPGVVRIRIREGSATEELYRANVTIEVERA